MPLIAGEPFRGLSVVRLTDTVTPANRRSYTVSIVDVVPDTASGDQATWEGNPGTSVTLRFEWDTAGTPGVGLTQAQQAHIEPRLPGGAIVGTQWAPLISGDSGSATRTFHFDDDPLNEISGSARWGMLEVYLNVFRNSVPLWDVNSRGTGSPPAGNTHDWARGYLRAPGILSSHTMSNVAINGAEPASWAFPDPVHTRITFDAQSYESSTVKVGLRSVANAEERNSSVASVNPFRDHSWTGTAGTNGANRIAEGMVLSSEVKDLRLDITAADFGGDNKYVFASTGHQAGFSRVSELVLQDDDRITVDPRLTWAYHMQFDANDFATPPTSHASTATTNGRLTSQLAFLVARITNARGEGQNGITVTRGLRDAGSLVPDEANDSVVTVAKGGQDGWEPSFITWDAALPAGTWTRTQTITSPADATDLDTPTTKTYALLAADPRIVLVVGGGPTSKPSHAVPGEPFQIGLSAFRAGERKLISVDSDGAGGHLAYVGVIRLQDSGTHIGRAEYLEADGTTWTPITDITTMSALHMHQLTQTRANSGVYTKTFTALQTVDWSTYDIFTVGECTISGTPYADKFKEVVVGTDNKHSGYEYIFNPIKGAFEYA